MNRLTLGGCFVSLLGCGPAVSDSGEGDTEGESAPASAGTGAGTSAGTSGSATTGATTSAGVTGDVTSGSADTGIPSGVGSDTTDPTFPTVTGGSSSGSSTTGGACVEDDGYRAMNIIGGIDRIRIFRRDDAAGSCTWLTLAYTGGQSQYEVASTAPWVLESAAWNNVPESCEEDFPEQMGENLIPEASGTIDLMQASPQQPCFIDLDVTLQLLSNPDPPVYGEMCQSMLTTGTCFL